MLKYREWVSAEGIRQIEILPEGLPTRASIEARSGKWVDESDYDILLTDSADVYGPGDEALEALGLDPEPLGEGRLLLSFRKGVFPLDKCQQWHKLLRGAAGKSMNRGAAAGPLDMEYFRARYGERMRVLSDNRISYTTEDGLVSNVQVSTPVNSGLVGFFNRTPRTPYCRQTAYTAKHAEEIGACYEYFQLISERFRAQVPGRWAAQQEFIRRNRIAEKGWAIPDTVFTTVTVNRNYRTGLHQDAGDLQAGFGNLTVLEGPGPRYEGGYTVFPQFRVAADVRTGDFLGMDVHEWHGNTSLRGEEGYERVSVVCYCRVEMKECDRLEVERGREEEYLSRVGNPQEQHDSNVAKVAREAREFGAFMAELDGQ